MILKNTNRVKEMNQGGISVYFLETGDIHEISYMDNQINLVKGNTIDGSLMNLYLRVHLAEGIQFTKLIGKHSESHFQLDKDRAIYRGSFIDIKYSVVFTMREFQWDFEVLLDSPTYHKIDVFYGQDAGIASKGAVSSSEAYTVQYIDYKSYKNDNGFTLCARQNQGKSQYLQIGSYTKNVAYSTDGFQFFGLSYKETGIPEAMMDLKLASKIYQYEFSYLALQSEMIELGGGVEKIKFYGFYYPKGYDAVERPLDILQIEKTRLFSMRAFQMIASLSMLDASETINGKQVSEQELKNKFNDMHHIERNGDGILSFFSKNHHHVVLKQKELLVERPHGHLMIHGDLTHVSEQVMATTNFMFGLFNSHLVLGNTSFNKMLGDSRNPLNVQKISGQRIYVRTNDTYHVLGIPSYYEMGGATTKWFYQLNDDAIIVEVFVDINFSHQALRIYSEKGTSYDFAITQQLLMGVNEHAYDIEYEREEQTLLFKAPLHSMFYEKYPNLKYKIKSNKDFHVISEKDAFNTEDQNGLLIMTYQYQHDVQLDTYATFNETFEDMPEIKYDDCDLKGTKYFESFTDGLHLSHPKYQQDLNKLSDITFWYTHNALTHYASPHGLEQSNGAAWGTRDVCQGPIEFFSAVQRYDLVREILLKVYKRQFIENGDFPQWYMFDQYYQIQAHDSHGDIIIWPLRALAYYLKATSDHKILSEQIPYMSIEKNEFTEPVSLLQHVILQVESIQKTFIPETSLPRYGGGDWDDTLQPANHDLTNKMVSGWTVALLYEALKELSTELSAHHQALSKELKELSLRVKADYEKYIIVDGIPAGFIVFNHDEITYLLHPRDQKTGLKYRLLPFTRSMISEIAEPKKIAPYLDIINKQFKHPDGVRLMDNTVEYKSGKKTYFSRAETAANFGREIGLQYVHAHIRYIEAMAKIGQANDAYEGLFTVNPILIQESVNNAYYRQSNVYFSSSDAWFTDRYQAKKEFSRIKSGSIAVKGGWRLYSSGPGIYINQMITNVFGIRLYHKDLVIDPVLPKKLDGMVLNYHFNHKPIEIHYHYGKEDVMLNQVHIPFEILEQKYRHPGILIGNHILNQIKEPIRLDVWFN